MYTARGKQTMTFTRKKQNENEGESGCVEVAKHLSVAGEWEAKHGVLLLL